MEGGASLYFCGEPRRLRFDWTALAELRKSYGPDLQSAVNVALSTADFDIMAEVLSVACARAVSAEEVMRDPPGIVPAIRALNEAFVFAYHGPEGPPKDSPRPLAMAQRVLRAIQLWIRSLRGSK
jgi:hypothetical protein